MGMANAHHSKEKYLQIANKLRGQKRSLETRNKISKALIGHRHSKETLAKLRGKKRSQEFCELMKKLALGRKAWNKGKKDIYSEETIEKIRQANLGKKRTLESRVKQSETIISHLKSKNPLYIPPSVEFRLRSNKTQKMRLERLKNNGGKHSKKQWEFLKAAYNYCCAMCHKIEPEIKLTKDHIIPIRNGGNDDISNIQPLCRSCNSKKR